MPAARQPATDSIEDNNASQETALREAVLRREAARQESGQAKSERKRAAVRENGKKGGRPPGSQTSTTKPERA